MIVTVKGRNISIGEKHQDIRPKSQRQMEQRKNYGNNIYDGCGLRSARQNSQTMKLSKYRKKNAYYPSALNG